MSSILEEIETKIADLKTSTSKTNVGVVRETGDGVARIEGLSDVMLNEMIEFRMGSWVGAQSRRNRGRRDSPRR
jgi:F-type H+-transporting ATPase subunit alpha